MPKISLADRLEARFRLLESTPDLSWKSYEVLRREMDGHEPGSGYHALRATAGPATDHPKWTRDWPSLGDGAEKAKDYRLCLAATGGHIFRAGTPAPRWGKDEIIMALMPQFRMWARGEIDKSVNGRHGARKDPNLVDDLAMNMATETMKVLAVEKDEGRVLGGNKGFVSFITARVRQAGAKGVGGTNEIRVARGRCSEISGITDSGKKGTPLRNPDRAREIAAAVAPEFRQATNPDGTGSSKLNSGNPYQQFSPLIFSLATRLADALESGDKSQVDALRTDAHQLYNTIKDSEVGILGTHHGPKVIRTPAHAEKPPPGVDKYNATPEQLEQYGPYWDREAMKRTSVTSVSGTRTADGGDIDITDTSSLKHLSDLDPDTVYQVLTMGRTTREQDLRHPSLAGKGLSPLSDFDLRYLIRQLAQWLPDGQYPGKGQPGRDVELIDGRPSKWIQDGQKTLWEKDDILRSIGSAGGDEDDESTGTQELLAKIPAGNARLCMQEIANDIMAGEKVNQAAIALRLPNQAGGLGVSKVMVGKYITTALKAMGMSSKEDFFAAIKSGGASLGGGSSSGGAAVAPGGVEPITKFAAWMRLYQEENALDESVDSIDYDIIWRCQRAVNELHNHLLVRQIMRAG